MAEILRRSISLFVLVIHGVHHHRERASDGHLMSDDLQVTRRPCADPVECHFVCDVDPALPTDSITVLSTRPKRGGVAESTQLCALDPFSFRNTSGTMMIADLHSGESFEH
jgi:hypothetical protein